MRKVQRYDSMQFVAGAVTTPEGFLLDSPIVARTGIYTYLQPDGSVRREYRPPDEVFAEDALVSFKGKPITVLHPKGGRVTADTAHKVTIGTIMSPAYRKNDTDVACDIIIHSPQETKGFRELSVGYSVELEETPGLTPDGEPYDAVQHLIRCNHLAVVPSARAGRKARLNLDGNEVLDGFESEENKNMVKIRIDSNEFEVEQAVANHITALTNKCDAANVKADAAETKFTQVMTELEKVKTDAADQKVKLDAAEAERDALKGKLDAAAAEKEAAIEKAVGKAKAEVKERAELDACAKKVQVEKTDGLDNKALKIAIVKALRGDSVDFEGKTDDYINAYYDSIKNDLNDTDEAVRQQLNKARQKLDGQESQTPATKHRQDMIDRMTNKKEEK